jgi:hypothetical protein
MLKKTIEYQDKKIVIYEQAFDHRENLTIYNQIVNLSFVRTNIDCYLLNNLDRDVKWQSMIDMDGPLSEIINKKYSRVISELDWSKVALKEQYVNYATSNTVDFLHTDVPDNNPGSYTLLHYANHTWNVNWHGETMFYSDNQDEVIYSVTIKPGSIVLFDSRLQHSAIAPSIVAEHPRYTIASKLVLKS